MFPIMNRCAAWMLSLLVANGAFAGGIVAPAYDALHLALAVLGGGTTPVFTDAPGAIEYGANQARLENRTDRMWTAESLQALEAMQQIQEDPSALFPPAAPVDFGMAPPETGWGGGTMGSTTGGTGGDPDPIPSTTGSTSGTTGTTTTGGSTGGTTTGGSTGGTTTGGSTGGSTGGTTGSAAGGLGFPWEGLAPGGGSPGAPGVVNTNTGNRHTDVPLVAWNGIGGADVEFSLMHDSRGFGAQYMPAGWRCSYDMWVYQSTLPIQPGETLTAIVHWPDGTAVPYTQMAANSPYYNGPPGIYERLKRTTTGWSLETKGLTTFEFNINGYLVKILDANSNALIVERPNGKQLSRVIDASGRALVLSYTNETLSSVVDPIGRTWTFTVSGGRQLSGITYPNLDGLPHTRSFTYDANNCIASETDLRGKVWTFSHDSERRIANWREPQPNPNQLTFWYDYHSCRFDLPAGGSVTHNYDSGALASEVDAAGFPENYGYDINRNLSRTTDRRGFSWYADYDWRGNVLKTFSPLRPPGPGVPQDEYTYNLKDQVLTHKNGVWRTTKFEYDLKGNLLKVRDDLDNIVEDRIVNSLGQVVNRQSVSSGPSDAVVIEYDSNGDVSAVTDMAVQRTSCLRNAIGWIESVTRPGYGTTYLGSDEWGRPVSTIHPSGSSTSAEYDLEDNVLSVTDEVLRTQLFTYDAAGRLATAANGRGDTEVYGYNGNGWLSSVRNGRGYTRAYDYTLRGDLRQITLPDGSFELWAFDANGNTTIRFVPDYPLSYAIGYQYDANGRMTLVDYPSGTDTTIEYNLIDQPTQMVDSTGTTNWSYNGLHQLTTLSTPQTTTTYTYNAAYRVETMKENGGPSTVYTYDTARRLVSQLNPLGETTAWEYDGYGRLQRQTVASGAFTDYGYDALWRQNSIEHKTSGGQMLTSESYVYSPASDLASKTVDGVTTSYTYDAADQLVSETTPGLAVSYSYDSNGNRLTKTVNGLTENYTYDEGDKLLTAGLKSYTYDAMGRTKSVTASGQTTTLSYDFEDRVVSIGHPGGGTSTYTYNGVGARLGKTTSAGSNTYRRAGVGVTAPVLGDGAANYTPGISESRAGVTKFAHTDRLGSTSRLTNASQTVTDTRSFDAFGMTLASSGTTPTPFDFAGDWGYQMDAESGLQLLGHRYYDASTGRFLTRDPIKDGRNWYGYCGNNPLRWVDPHGLERITLPSNPTGLPDGWTRLPHGGDSGAERWLAPGGREGLEFHPGKKGAPGHGGKDHWHRLKRKPNGRLEKEDKHLKPGEDLDVDTTPAVDSPEPESMWRHVDWGEAGRRTTYVVVGGAVVLVVVGSGGTAAVAAGALVRAGASGLARAGVGAAGVTVIGGGIRRGPRR